jgi:chromosome segregation ATPase
MDASEIGFALRKQKEELDALSLMETMKNSEIFRLRGQLDRRDQSIQDLIRKNSDANKDIEILVEENENLARQSRSYQAEITGLEDAINDLRAELSLACRRYSGAKGRNKVLFKRLMVLRDQAEAYPDINIFRRLRLALRGRIA